MSAMHDSRPFAMAAAVALGRLAGLAGLAGLAPGCGTEAVGVETCRQVEEARCLRAQECGVDLSVPLHGDDDATACTRYYKDVCLHGLASKNDPAGPRVKACVAAIAAGACTVVLTPESDPACDFLIPAVTPVVDAGDAGDASDAAAAVTDAAIDG